MVLQASAAATVVTKLLLLFAAPESVNLVFVANRLLGGESVSSVISPNTGCNKMFACASMNSTICLNRALVFDFSKSSYAFIRHRSLSLYGSLDTNCFKVDVT